MPASFRDDAPLGESDATVLARMVGQATNRVDGWRPIETYDRKGFVLLSDGETVTVGHYSHMRQRFIDDLDEDGFTFVPPKYWRNIPAPPRGSREP